MLHVSTMLPVTAFVVEQLQRPALGKSLTGLATSAFKVVRDLFCQSLRTAIDIIPTFQENVKRLVSTIQFFDHD